jgi:formate hydrogenlyase subunit 6/NADH:ubiquinone oxidoreductase subunit I
MSRNENRSIQGGGVFHAFKSFISAMKVTLPYIFGWTDKHKEVTEEYPDRVSARMPEDLPARFRGILKNDIDKCSGCRLCVSECPISCIRIETEPGPIKNESWVSVFDIDLAKCMFCGLCVEVCPTGSLFHTRNYEESVLHIQELVVSYGKGWATSEMKSKWQIEQKIKEQKERELIAMRQSPIGSEIRKLMGEKKE